MSIICLETQSEEVAAWELSKLIQQARDENDENLIVFLRSLWDDESWESICRKADVEGSCWYVWWMDGVRAFMRQEETES